LTIAPSSSIQLLSAGAVSPGLVKVIEAFRRECGADVEVIFATAPEIRRKIDGAESFAVVIAPIDLLGDLIKDGKVRAEPINIGRIGVGVMVRQGAPLPDIAGVDEFIQSLRSADSVVYNQASTGVYLEGLFQRLGVAALVEAKRTRYPDFAAVRDHVSRGHGSEIGFGATTVIVENSSKGIRFVGPLPAELQNYTTYAAAAVRQNGDDEARRLLAYLGSPAAKVIFAAAGIA
jgi:molybdate transport system substrate-binding protein